MDFCGSWLACDAGTSVDQLHRVDAIAGKPAPHFDRSESIAPKAQTTAQASSSSTHCPPPQRRGALQYAATSA
ncbi:hypothetical protein FEM54_19760 [Pseudomonas edaphica]|uniref:Uncharacterized protein n=1 Tax=Pseudomonas edaphica TaxID=2006980 RepID=A0ABY2U264_9PSED|nr:hypothetical protein FEM54_19760 [Pseudomonas edaphica]